ncbi:RNA polymerase sigma factor [Micromonospora gifhornensis]|uniref:DNA-directed RNA polymerase sigma-70 factor n=1 Tax=Micromonospora gifhornensis TaxID=84594 RepID=A0ABQ4IBF4_9ACTN|nr:DNA-directed RNA polymerase sigma-70 factor [Micromonospora gifhornensis]
MSEPAGPRSERPPPAQFVAPSQLVGDDVLLRESVECPERFATLFDRHAVAVHRYLARRVGNAADDLLAETFLIAFRRRSTYRSQGVDPRAWLYGIATNVLRRQARQEERRYRMLARLATSTSDVMSSDDDAVERADAQALRQQLAVALARLKRGDRDVLLLTAWAGLSYAEIAAVLAIPVGTVRSRLNRARRLTRESLSSAMINEELI